MLLAYLNQRGMALHFIFIKSRPQGSLLIPRGNFFVGLSL